MPAQWSAARWPKKPDKIAQARAIAAAAAELALYNFPPPPPVEEKWMAGFNNKRFYFTAAGLRAAEDKASLFFGVTRYAPELMLGVMSC